MGEYRRDLDARFRLALERAAVRFEPGSRYEYSGTGFYVLAYVVGRSLAGTPESDAKTLLRAQLMQPLGIPDRAWRINYGRVSWVDGMSLYALGSGADYTPRAIARVGQLLLDQGRHDGRTLVSPEHVQAMLHAAGSPPTRAPEADHPATGFGTWLNCDGYFPSLPRDAVIGAGASHQLLLVVPSWQLVLVRLGRQLGQDVWEGDYWDALEAGILAPLARALPEPSPTPEVPGCGASSRAAQASKRATRPRP
jgi:CubicO group peptidase (beta-lactamase class C family)